MHRRKTEKLKSGDRVRVAAIADILATLDDRQRCDGLLFGPGMERYCGHEFQVLRNVKWFFDEGTRRMLRCRGVVVLKDAICQGRGALMGRDCDRCCSYLWKVQWLERVPTRRGACSSTTTVGDSFDSFGALEHPSPARSSVQSASPNGKTPAMTEGFECQYTAMTAIGSDLGLLERMQQFLLTLSPRVRRRLWKYRTAVRSRLDHGQARRSNPASFTSATKSTEDLREGEWVGVKSFAAIERTLSARRTCRGLQFLDGMRRYCGGTYRVQKIPVFVIDQGGRKVNLCKDVVILSGLYCDGVGEVDGCDKSCLHYWKLDWLDIPAR